MEIEPELTEAFRKAVQTETRFGIRDDSQIAVKAVWLRLIELLDARYQKKKGQKPK